MPAVPSLQRICRPFWILAALTLLAGVGALAALAAPKGAAPPDVCSNLRGVQHKIPAGYKRGHKLTCVKKAVPCTGKLAYRSDDGKCHHFTPPPPNPPPPPPQPIEWWPSGYTGWAGDGSNTKSPDGTMLIAYAPASCPATNGGSIPNGGKDSFGRTCWAYTMLLNVQWTSGKTGCGTLYAEVQEFSNGVIVGYTNDLQSSIPNGQPVLMHGSASSSGFPDLTLKLSKIDCFAS